MILHIQRKKYLYLSFNKSISKEKSYKRKYYLFLWMFWLDVLLFGFLCVCVYLIQHEVILSSLIKLTQQWVLHCTRTVLLVHHVLGTHSRNTIFPLKQWVFSCLNTYTPGTENVLQFNVLCIVLSSHLWDLLYQTENSLNLIHVSLLGAWGFIKISRRFFGLLAELFDLALF